MDNGKHSAQTEALMMIFNNIFQIKNVNQWPSVTVIIISINQSQINISPIMTILVDIIRFNVYFTVLTLLMGFQIEKRENHVLFLFSINKALLLA